MKRILTETIRAAVAQARASGELSSQEELVGLTIEVPRLASHGDWATNAAMIMADMEKRPPRELAETIIKYIEDEHGYLNRIEIAGPGFINFALSEKWWRHVLREIHRLGADYGRLDMGRGQRVLIEFVSTNPTGPLHVGHGRGAAVGDALARVLSMAGYEVSREYYVNDTGNQARTLGRSVLYRYLELFGREVNFTDDLYQGGYIRGLAAEMKHRHQDRFLDLPEEEAVEAIYSWAVERILEGIKQDLASFNVFFDHYFSEKSLVEQGKVDQTLEELKARGHIYEKDGAIWFRSTSFGDDKDRPVIKSNGETTYITPDLVYHRDKYLRGYDRMIDVLGADHHGYVPRLMAGVEAMGFDRSRLNVLLVQMVNWLRGGTPVSMSTRAGEYVTVREVLDEIGSDAARFIFLTRRPESRLDFDLEVAKNQSNENPVYYVQYAHARIASVFRTALKEGLELPGPEEADLSLLTQEEELTLTKHLAAFPDLIEGAVVNLEPHRLTHYLTDLAGLFHPYYNRHRFISHDLELSRARLLLAKCTQQVVASGLELLGVNAPESM
ncbi:MAG: arginine--tRNA ligase [Deltaproteobacteria bacterium]|nr:arginine--tRNA ligase [Deltaproteobacteria bacterium]MBW2085370.1 arginine--tRNA ligase [Deltaproteobacteria bacterium]